MDMDRIQFPLPGEERKGKERGREGRKGEERRGEVLLDHSQSVHWSCKAYSLTSDIIKTCVCEWEMETEMR